MKLDWLKHAFAVEKSDDFNPTDEQKEIAAILCAWVVKRNLTTPAVLLLESSQGLNYIGAHVMHFFQPAVAALLDTHQYQQFALMLEHRGSIDYLCRLLEEIEKQSTTETQRPQRNDLEKMEQPSTDSEPRNARES